MSNSNMPKRNIYIGDISDWHTYIGRCVELEHVNLIGRNPPGGGSFDQIGTCIGKYVGLELIELEHAQKEYRGMCRSRTGVGSCVELEHVELEHAYSNIHMGRLRFVGSFKLQVSVAECVSFIGLCCKKDLSF